jgi:predicted RNA polymerase sigma factor
VLSTLIRQTGDFELAGDALQDAFVAALETWPSRGVPGNPGAWITATARATLGSHRHLACGHTRFIVDLLVCHFHE